MKRRLPSSCVPIWLLVVLLTLLEATLAWAETGNERFPIPACIEASEPLRPILQTMWDRSPTFRRQCARIGGARLQVVLDLGTALQVGRRRARASFVASNGRFVRAEIHVLWNPHSIVELVAHELEHVIEQLDGVQLTGRAQAGVYRSASGAFETARAIYIGEQVAREVRRSRDSTFFTEHQ
jgi:hypothetical protein